ncbi:MAG TPA: hypothetical protein VIJ14_05135 [Rhabdochlamydiaceae bacterium]
MNTLKIYWPFKPYIITQAWGVKNDDYLPLGFDHHNGIDAINGSNRTKWPVYCPVDGFKVTEVAFYPKGGGKQIGMVSKQKLQIGDKLCFVSIILCHADKVLVPVGYEPVLGEMITVADNTGFSTGAHTHMGMYRLNDDLSKMDSNDETGSYDPSLCFANAFAVDQASLATLIKSDWRYYQYVLGY